MIGLLLFALAAQDTVLLRPVVVTATRVPLPADQVAAAVTVLAGADLRAQGIRTVADALRAVAGVAVVATGGAGGQTSLFLRGGESDYVKVLVDGVPLNQPGGAIDFADLTTDNVERIEIVRGPASVLYGSDAMTGVIQIFTRAGAARPTIGAEAAAGTYGTRTAAAEIFGGSGRVAYSAQASWLSADGLYRYNNEYRNTVVSGRLSVTPSTNAKINVAYRYGDDVYHLPTDAAGDPVDSNAVSADRGPLVSLALERRFGAVEARVSGTWRETRLTFDDQEDFPGEGAFSSRDYVRRAGTGAAITWTRPDAIVLAGIEYEEQRQRGRSAFSVSVDTFPDSIAVRRFTTGYYAQAIVGTNRPVTATVGLRVDDNSQFGNYATARAGVTWRLDDRTRLRLGAGTGFKEPTFFENFARGFVQGNPDLDPERSQSYEAGLEHTFPGDRVTIAVTYFDQRFRDLIEFVSNPPPGEPNYFNVSGASADGVEAEITGAAAGIEFGVRYTYLDTRVLQGGPDGGPDALFVPGRSLVRRPGHTLAPQISTVLGRTHLALAGRWVGTRDDIDFGRAEGDRRVTLPAYAHLDVTGEYVLPSWSVMLRIDNLFDDRTPEPAGFPARGRTIMLGARAIFRMR
ncbi:MAG: TonB-dependent receptor [Gemmatimonadales bacterium]|nr:TonB-dependent receptor [Gemmatimonadales bacterium]